MINKYFALVLQHFNRQIRRSISFAGDMNPFQLNKIGITTWFHAGANSAITNDNIANIPSTSSSSQIATKGVLFTRCCFFCFFLHVSLFALALSLYIYVNLLPFLWIIKQHGLKMLNRYSFTHSSTYFIRKSICESLFLYSPFLFVQLVVHGLNSIGTWLNMLLKARKEESRQSKHTREKCYILYPVL